MTRHHIKVFALLVLVNLSCEPMSVLFLTIKNGNGGFSVQRVQGDPYRISEGYDGIIIKREPNLRFRVSSLSQSEEVSDTCQFLYFIINIQMDTTFNFEFRRSKLLDAMGGVFETNKNTRRVSSNGKDFPPLLNHELVVGFGSIDRRIILPASLIMPAITVGHDSISLPEILVRGKAP